VPVRIKICGITRVEDALLAVEAGADALGFVFAESPRRITPEAAAGIIRELPPFVQSVGLVVNADPRPILEVCPLDLIQFHGEEPPEAVASAPCRAIKAFRVRRKDDLSALDRYPNVAAFLLDAYVPGLAGGTGHRFPWELATIARSRTPRPIIVAGGLTPENVAECVRATTPYAVDVSSGVEQEPGRKDPERLRAFIREARACS
jgi:phosphoribosylanthranilate isomerase